MANAPGPAIFQSNGPAVGSDAVLSVGAPIDAAAGLTHVEVASRVDEHLLAAEKAAVAFTRRRHSTIVRQHRCVLLPPAISRQPVLASRAEVAGSE